MALLEKIDIRRSFALKICSWMMAMTAVVFLVCAFFASWYAGEMMLEDGHEKANIELDKAVLFINNEMNIVETAGRNFASRFDADHKMPADEVYAVCREFLKTNPEIQGISLAFEPEVYPEYAQGFSPYVMMRDGKEFIECNLGDKYDYFGRDWYKETLHRTTPRWTTPYQEVNGTVISIYCFPIVNSKGKHIGVFAFDMSLDQLTEHTEKIRPYPNSYITLMDRDLNFLVHPDRELIMEGSAMKVLDKSRYEVNETIFIDIQNHKRGFGAFSEEGDRKFLYYSPIMHTDWTVTLECGEEEITAGVSAVRAQLLFVSSMGMIGLFIICFFIIRRSLVPIRLYSDAALSIAEGNFNTPMPKMHDHNELWLLGNSLDYMQKSLDKHINELKITTQEKGRIESELNIASQIQMSMIPKIFPPYPERDDIDIHGILIPAKAVGGDLYDFFLRDEKLFFCVGDVSGKGVPASLVMAVTRSLLRMVAAQEIRPERIVASINNSMSDMNESNMFVTLFVGVLDLVTGRLRYCNAGHNAPVIIDENSREVRMLDVKPNLPVAVLPDIQYEMQEIVIEPGMSIFMYTDGLTEAENGEKRLYGEEKMMEVLRSMEGMTSKEQIETMLNAVRKHVNGAEQSDDLTMVSLKYKCQQSRSKSYRRLSLHNDIRETPKIANFMDDIASETGISMALANSLNLALEEAVVNVMNYAYPENTVGDIFIEASADNGEIVFVITDKGIPFDPTKSPEPDITADVEQRPIGGLGIFLVTHLMDSVKYERIDDKNVLTLRKNIDNDKEQA